ncbi:MAG: hypothetical protein IPO92_07740 [Saprospiraceae bacterium]|nr:hypothetical protein [Saprospiraceae bacterium]
MKAASLVLIRKELETCTHQRVIELALKLTRFKTENKELISFLLFDADDIDAYIREVKTEITVILEDINMNNMYLAKKSVRKMLKLITKYSRYTGIKETEVDLLIFFCKSLRKSGLPVSHVKSLSSIYFRQIEKLDKLVHHLHEDLQFDYNEEIQLLKM